MPAFHETQMGRKFFESQVPKIIKALERIADALEEQNKPVIEEKEKSDDENRS